nr:hypothetical protein CFP56_63998 [Quercus suber]
MMWTSHTVIHRAGRATPRTARPRGQSGSSPSGLKPSAPPRRQYWWRSRPVPDWTLRGWGRQVYHRRTKSASAPDPALRCGLAAPSGRPWDVLEGLDSGVGKVVGVTIVDNNIWSPCCRRSKISTSSPRRTMICRVVDLLQLNQAHPQDFPSQLRKVHTSWTCMMRVRKREAFLRTCAARQWSCGCGVQ